MFWPCSPKPVLKYSLTMARGPAKAQYKMKITQPSKCVETLSKTEIYNKVK